MSLRKALGIEKTFCETCGVRLELNQRHTYREFKDGYYCKFCADKKSKVMGREYEKTKDSEFIAKI